jgi:oxygen-independent coproporphyrinogen-3 oxidase
MPDDDLMADMYLLVDQLCEEAGLSWYELSNWSKPGKECLHNIAYWKSANWWGLGPGAHSHLNGERWWNVKHPTAYKTKLFNGESPVQDRETMNSSQLRDEEIMLAIRMREGLSFEALKPQELERLASYREEGYLDTSSDRIKLTPTGRLIADRIVREIVM